MPNKLWEIDGRLIENESGELVECEECPCEVSPCCTNPAEFVTVDISEFEFTFFKPAVGGPEIYCSFLVSDFSAVLPRVSDCLWSNVDLTKVGVLPPNDPDYYTTPISLFGGLVLLELGVEVGPNASLEEGDCIAYLQAFTLHRTDTGESWSPPSTDPEYDVYLLGDPIAFFANLGNPVGVPEGTPSLVDFVVGLPLGCALEPGYTVGMIAVAEVYE